MSLFSPLELGAKQNWEKLWRRAWDASSAGNDNLRIATVSPGYDDTHLKAPLRAGNKYRLVDRQDGAVYKEMQNFVLGLEEKPDLLIISTFNEFHESTHIEPTVENGTFYLEETKAFIDKVRNKWA